MSIKTLLVCLTTEAHAADLMKVAVPLARKHNAHLIGLHTLEALVVYPGVAMHISSDIYRSFNASQKKQSDAIGQIFEDHTRAETFVSEYRVLKAKSTTATDRMVESAHAADLVIMAHEDKNTDRFDQRHAQSEMIRRSGRPVIVVPLGYDGPELGQRLLLGWSDTREAARAAHDMISVADRDATVTVLRINGGTTDEALRDFTAIDVSDTLARHGLSVETQHETSGRETIADVLMNTASAKGADLVVVGAFGHSKVHDLILGATTHKLLRDARLPVMFSN